MNQIPAICLGCGNIRFLQSGNPRPHTCGDNRIVWVETTAKATRIKIIEDFKAIGVMLSWDLLQSVRNNVRENKIMKRGSRI